MRLAWGRRRHGEKTRKSGAGDYFIWPLFFTVNNLELISPLDSLTHTPYISTIYQIAQHMAHGPTRLNSHSNSFALLRICLLLRFTRSRFCCAWNQSSSADRIRSDDAQVHSPPKVFFLGLLPILVITIKSSRYFSWSTPHSGYRYAYSAHPWLDIWSPPKSTSEANTFLPDVSHSLHPSTNRVSPSFVWVFNLWIIRVGCSF